MERLTILRLIRFESEAYGEVDPKSAQRFT